MIIADVGEVEGEIHAGLHVRGVAVEAFQVVAAGGFGVMELARGAVEATEGAGDVFVSKREIAPDDLATAGDLFFGCPKAGGHFEILELEGAGQAEARGAGEVERAGGAEYGGVARFSLEEGRPDRFERQESAGIGGAFLAFEGKPVRSYGFGPEAGNHRVVWLPGAKGRENLDLSPEVLDGGFRTTEIFVGATGDFREPAMGIGEEEGEVAVINTGFSEAFEAGEGGFDEAGTDGGGSGEFAEFAVGFGKEGKAHVEHVLFAGAGEAALRFSALEGELGLGIGGFQLPEAGIGNPAAGIGAHAGQDGGNGERDDGDEGQEGGRDGEAVAADEAAEGVEGRARAGFDRALFEEVPQVGGECGCGGVAERRVMFGGFVEDGAEVGVEVGGGGKPEAFRVTDGLGNGKGGPLAGRLGGENLKKDDAEREDIGSGGDFLAADLFWAGVIEREGAEECAGVSGGVLGEAGDAEVKEFGVTGRGDQDVGRFEIAMDHKVGVGVLDGLSDLDKETDAGRDGEGGGVLGKREAVDEFEDKVWVGMMIESGIEEAGDVRVVEASEESFFGDEAAAGLRGGEGGVEELDGGEHLGLPVGSLGEPDYAHSAAAEFSDQLPRAEAGAGGQWRAGPFEETGGGGLGGEQFTRLDKKVRMGGEGGFEGGVALVGGEFEGGGEGVVQQAPLAGSHLASGAAPGGESSRNSQRRATFQWRFTVAGERPIAAAVSSMERSAK